MRRLLSVIAVLIFAVACQKEVVFTCRVVDSDATKITQTGVKLEATVHASDYAVIEEMANNPKVVPYLDMPIQHINDRVLKSMNRKGGTAIIKDAVARLRKASDVYIRRTLL
mgnify:CR=1 FL=1